MTRTALNTVLGVYDNLVRQAPILAHIQEEHDYEAALEFIEMLMEVIGDHPEDPRWGCLKSLRRRLKIMKPHITRSLMNCSNSIMAPPQYCESYRNIAESLFDRMLRQLSSRPIVASSSNSPSCDATSLTTSIFNSMISD